MPSSNPTPKPTTAKPTFPGDTAPPTGIPTGRPTWDLVNYQDSDLYSVYESKRNTFSTTWDKFDTYGTFTYKGTTFKGMCSAWLSHTNSLQLPFDDLYFSSFSILHGFIRNGLVKTVHDIEYKCEQRNDVQLFLEALSNRKSFSTYCGTNHLFKVFVCNNELVMCVDCEEVCGAKDDTATKTGERLCPGRSGFYRDKSILPAIVNPCIPKGSCLSNLDSYTIIGWDIGVDILYPQLIADTASPTKHLNVTSDLRSISVNLAVNTEGSIFCGAVPEDTVVSCK
jgi:hypothetical protein